MILKIHKEKQRQYINIILQTQFILHFLLLTINYKDILRKAT